MTFDRDTIDTWEIYNGSQLILNGKNCICARSSWFIFAHIKESDLKDLEIMYNHSTPTIEFSATIEFLNEKTQSVVYKKEFHLNARDKMVIERDEIIDLIKGKTMWIRYTETKTNEVSVSLGFITVE